MISLYRRADGRPARKATGSTSSFRTSYTFLRMPASICTSRLSAGQHEGDESIIKLLPKQYLSASVRLQDST